MGTTNTTLGSIPQIISSRLPDNLTPIERNVQSNTWVSVKWGLPDPGKRVLVCFSGFVGEAYLKQAGYWVRYDGTPMFYQPTHWMDLPKPPEEVE